MRALIVDRARLLVVGLAIVLVGAACGGSSKAAAPKAQLEVAGPTPSASARMLCNEDVRTDLAAALGVEALTVSKPSWDATSHVYSCDYGYAGGAVLTLTVKELSSVDETTQYFDTLGDTLGRGKSLEIGEGAYTTTNGSLVVRKDYKVLLVDVSHLPARFGKPLSPRAAVASNIGGLVMACWKVT